LERSEANGPGVRSVVWFQGCQIRCPGCWNPDTHSTENSSLVSVDELLERFLAIDVDGITLTGGEPLDQMDGCIELARRVKSSGRSVVLFTGYHMSEITRRAATSVLQSCFDSILCGPYNRALEETAELGLLRDKVIWHLSETYSDEDFLSLPEAEIIIAQDYSIVTGLGLPTKKRDRAWFSS
jgi:anaerobic ribonucleoside-triphosphate reductase activating protein